MNILNKFKHLFDIVNEPEYSKQKLIEFENKYPDYLYATLVVEYHYGGKYNVLNKVPDFEDWMYYKERFERYKKLEKERVVDW